MKVIKDCFSKVITPENIWLAWRLYRRGKREHPAVICFEYRLEENLLEILSALEQGTYVHGDYFQFIVHDPKRRLISVPTVRDHVVHQALMNVLVPFWETVFSPFSFSCRLGKGTHRACNLLWDQIRAQSRGRSRTVWILHGDIQKCFDSISHSVLKDILRQRITCERTLRILHEIIDSYTSPYGPDAESGAARGIPLGNLTSQLFVNAVLDRLDRFVKEELKVKRYVRYADDFLLTGESEAWCAGMSDTIRNFLHERLDLRFPKSHEQIRELRQGIETLGIRFSNYGLIIRPRTKHHAEGLLSRAQQDYDKDIIGMDELNSLWQSVRGLAPHLK